jgi:hypothetical protein
MWPRVTLCPRRHARAIGGGLATIVALSVLHAALRADDGVPDNASSRPATPAGETRRGPDSRDQVAGGTRRMLGPRIESGAAIVTTATPAFPGARITLEINRGSVEWSQFYWTQVEGPPVKIDDPTAPAIRVVVPSGAERLGFLFVATSSEVVRVYRLTVPLQQGSSASTSLKDSSQAAASARGAAAGELRANAGDDQVGLVGHRVTLNGTRSVPADGSAARWVQVSGPAVFAPEQQGLYYSFVPVAPGTYRFVLLTSARGGISDPDDVSVVVGTPPPGPAAGGPGAPYGAAPPATPGWATSLDQIVSSVLPHLVDSSRIAGAVADIFDAISERCSLYTSFGELQSEVSRRLDGVIPADPTQRSAWIQSVFLPLTSITANELLASGIDIRVRAGVEQALTPAQQERIRNHFQRMAKAFRAFAASR